MLTDPVKEIDQILVLQLLVAWAGEGRSEPKRLGWWETDLVDDAGGGDLIARIAPRTHAWASLDLVREAARQADQRARNKLGNPDKLRTLFFLGFELDEKLDDRIALLKREGSSPEKALPLPFKLGAQFDRGQFLAFLEQGGAPSFEKVPPLGRRLKGGQPTSAAEMSVKLAAALLPIADEYPLPFFKAER